MESRDRAMSSSLSCLGNGRLLEGGGWAGEVKGEPGGQAGSGLGGLAQLRRRTAVGTAQSRP